MATAQSPLSPHMIYKPQLTSVLSITHRFTGIFLSVGALLLSYWLLSIAMGAAAYAQALAHFTAWYGKVALLLFVFSFYFHLCNGIRHLCWDMGLGLEIKSAYQSGYIMLFFSIVLTAGSCYLGGLA